MWKKEDGEQQKLLIATIQPKAEMVPAIERAKTSDMRFIKPRKRAKTNKKSMNKLTYNLIGKEQKRRAKQTNRRTGATRSKQREEVRRGRSCPRPAR